jgi:hypothetical protein
VNGRALHFYLAGINNQNFLMRDKETGTWWQQITGKAIYGPLKGAALDLVLSDELMFGTWKQENSAGQVLAPVAKYTKEYDPKWEPEIAKLPVVISFPGTELKSRDVVVGLTIEDSARAYPWETLVKQSPIVDHVHGTPLLVAIGPDKKSFRVFVGRVDGKDTEFFLKGEADDSKDQIEASKETKADSKDLKGEAPKAEGPKADQKADSKEAASKDAADKKSQWVLLDTATASEWNFQGCAISGPSQGKCLDRIPALKDYWFDWRNYHHDTTVYKH